MSRAIAVNHGLYGRACLYEMNRAMAMHAHREGHLIFYLQGHEPSITVSGSRLSLGHDRAVAVNPFQLHDGCFAEHSHTLLLVLYIDSAWFVGMQHGLDVTMQFGNNQITITTHIDRLLQRVCHLLSGSDDQELIDHYLYELTNACFAQSRQHLPASNSEAAYSKQVRDNRIRKSIDLMRERVGGALALNEIASDAGLSRPHFYKLFRENVGITPNVYLNTLRMDLAIQRLITSDDAVTSIGLDLGFASQASFTRFFATHVGIPPTDYRRVAHFAS